VRTSSGASDGIRTEFGGTSRAAAGILRDYVYSSLKYGWQSYQDGSEWELNEKTKQVEYKNKWWLKK